MANRMEHQVGIKAESSYNTPVTVDRFVPYLDGTEGNWDTRQRQGQGVMVSTRRGFRGDRRVLPIGQGEVVIKAEAGSRQFGLLLEAAAGAGTVTAITGGSLQLFTPSIPGTVMPKSYTIQLAKVRNDGTVDTETFGGCTAVSAEIECPEDDILTVQVTFDARSYQTGVPLAVASYTAASYLFDHSQGAAGVGGTLVAPTTTTLASGLTPFGAIRSWKLEWEQNADIERWVLGGRNQPTVGILEPEFTADVEYNDTTLRTAYLAGTGLPVTVTHTTTEVVGSGNSQLQVAIPQLFLESPVTPGMADETAVVGITGKVTYNNTHDLFYIGYRTADTAL
ncbi:phage tail tube protein [Kineosporia succinea]|uniref:Uncharacterized protein n=1 Tax=Kineosporia succinea TaxID=84632 RepID=A0ABT9P5U3_9ACTN|nr:phage tail tube protein [Kineosporia succinea]MDP9828042.1 hypothetical protein [Kineosporia succinea]